VAQEVHNLRVAGTLLNTLGSSSTAKTVCPNTRCVKVTRPAVAKIRLLAHRNVLYDDLVDEPAAKTWLTMDRKFATIKIWETKTVVSQTDLK